MKTTLFNRLTAGLLAAALCLSVLAGCAAKPQKELTRYSTIFYDVFDTVTQVIAYCESEEEFTKQMEALHADLISYNQLYDIYNDYDGVVNVKTINDNAGKAPVQVDDRILSMLELAQKMYDTTNGKAYKDVVIPSMISLAGSLFDGKTMCIPYIPQAFMIFCNKGLLEECGVTEYPQTWEELMDACEKVKAAGHIPVTTDSNYCTSWVGYYMSRRLGNDRVMELAKDSSQWASEQGIKDTAEAIAYMAAKGYFDPNIESNVYPAAQQDMVISENVAMYINGTWLPNEVAETTPDDFKWGAFAFPEVPNGVEGTECGCYSTYAIAVNKDCDDAATQAAVEFIVYLTTSEWDQEFTNQANAIPMNVDHVWPENLADAQVVLNSYTSRYPSQTAIITNSDSKQIIADACLKLMGGSISADEFIKMASAF